MRCDLRTSIEEIYYLVDLPASHPATEGELTVVILTTTPTKCQVFQGMLGGAHSIDESACPAAQTRTVHRPATVTTPRRYPAKGDALIVSILEFLRFFEQFDDILVLIEVGCHPYFAVPCTKLARSEFLLVRHFFDQWLSRQQIDEIIQVTSIHESAGGDLLIATSSRIMQVKSR